MAALPKNALTFEELIAVWRDKCPPLRDQGEADTLNRMLGNLLSEFADRGRAVPDPIFFAAMPPIDDRARLIAEGHPIEVVIFEAAVLRWNKSPHFKAFWDTLSDEGKKSFMRAG
jgi:hypothetical protein